MSFEQMIFVSYEYDINQAKYLSYCYRNNYSGFFIVTGFYFLLAIIIMLGKKQLIMAPIRNFILKKLLHDEQA